MFTICFIDWELIEKTASKDFGAVLNFDEFARVIREVAESKGHKLVAIKAYGDFDKGEAGLQSKLVLLGIEPYHVVTKTSMEYLKGSTDIELALDVLETSFMFPHLDDFVFVGGDGDFIHVMRRLRKYGKSIRLLSWKHNTKKRLYDVVDEFISLDGHPSILRKVTTTEKERKMSSLQTNSYVHKVIQQLHRLEEDGKKEFIGLNYFRTKLLDKYRKEQTYISEALTDCLQYELIIRYEVSNPNDPSNPTSACRLNYDNPVVLKLLD